MAGQVSNPNPRHKKPDGKVGFFNNDKTTWAIMNTITNSSNTGPGVTRLAQIENVSRPVSMTSLELVDFINDHRKQQAAQAGQKFPAEGFAKLQHKHFLDKVPEVLGERSAEFSANLPDSYGRPRKGYRFPKRESCLLAMSYSYELQAAVYDYMTELESRQAVTLPDFSNPAASARAWAEQFELQQAAQQALALAAPKVAFVDQYVEATGSMGFRQVAKLLNANERQFRQMLLDKGAMYYLGGVLTPYSQHQDADRFEVKTGTSETSGHAFSQARFAPKGVQWVAGLWSTYQMEISK